VVGGTLLAVLIAGLMWRVRRQGTDVSPVSEQWLAERRTHRDRD